MLYLVFILLIGVLRTSKCQDYEIADVQCFVGDNNQHMIARLRKPQNFSGHPIFADDLKVNPRTDANCQIRLEPNDISKRIYRLAVNDFSRCGITKHGGYIHLRIWFPMLPSAMTSQDQEVILICKPPEPTVLVSKTAELASTGTGQARVSGVVEESYAKLEYQVAIYRQPEDRNSRDYQRSFATGTLATRYQQQNNIPLNEAVPIGTQLQLRVNINPNGVWRYAKLVEVTVSPDVKSAYADGYIQLVYRGCRNPELPIIISRQPKRTQPTEIIMEFEAFLLANYSLRTRRESQQWIHTTVLACVEERDCRPEICSDSAPAYGRRKRTDDNNETKTEIRFDNRIPMRILLPKDSVDDRAGRCQVWIISSGVLICALILCLIPLALISYLYCLKKKQLEKTILANGTSGQFMFPHRVLSF